MSSSLHRPRAGPSETAAGRLSNGPPLATQVCSACKTRKKKCDKALPRCGFCVRKTLGCGYDYESISPSPPGAHQQDLPATATASARPVILPLPPVGLPAVAAGAEASLYLQVQSAIRAAGLFVDDVCVRYFQGVHHHLPVVSRTRFHNDLTTLGSTPSPDFSALLLAICLISSCSALRRHDHVVRKATLIGHSSLYLTARSIFAQVQALILPSLYLVQAGLLLALYEYIVGQPDKAFASIAGCARMAYAARIQLCNMPLPQPWQSVSGANTDRLFKVRNQEAANTWWGIIICERTFFCDVSVIQQPLLTVIAGGDAPLPSEPAILEQIDMLSFEPVPNVPVSCLSSVDVDSFGRAAQAAWLLDQVIKAFDISDIDTRLFQLQGLDTTLQSFLIALMQQAGEGSKSCKAVTITIRALFALHWHILDLYSGHVGERHQALLDWRKSDAALDTVTKMVLDVVEAVENDKGATTGVTPGYPYLIRAALKHIYKKAEWEEDSWLRSAEGRLLYVLDQLHLD